MKREGEITGNKEWKYTLHEGKNEKKKIQKLKKKK